MRCVTCDRAVRKPGQKLVDHPGTIVIAALGKCATCYTKGRKNSLPSPVQANKTDIGDIPCVLVRVDLTPNTYKALRKAGVDIANELSRAADRIVEMNHA